MTSRSLRVLRRPSSRIISNLRRRIRPTTRPRRIVGGRRNTGLSNRMMGDKRTPTKNPKDLQPLADSSSPVIGSQNNSQAPVNNRQQVVHGSLRACYPCKAVKTCYNPETKSVVAFVEHPGLFMYEAKDVNILPDNDKEDDDDDETEPDDIMDTAEHVEVMPKKGSYTNCTDPVEMASYMPQRTTKQMKRRGRVVYECPWCGQKPSVGRIDKVKTHIHGLNGTSNNQEIGCKERRRVQGKWLQRNPGKELPGKLIKVEKRVADLDKDGYMQ